MLDKKLWRIMTLIGAFMIASSANARHLKLYAYDIADVGSTVVTYTFDRVSGPKAGVAEGNPMLHEIEIEYAINEHWMQSLYFDYDYSSSTANFSGVGEISSLKTEFNIPFSEKGKHFFDFRLNIELAKALNSQTSAYGETDAADTAEFRFIFEKNFENFTLILGPMFVQNIGGRATWAARSMGSQTRCCSTSPTGSEPRWSCIASWASGAIWGASTIKPTYWYPTSISDWRIRSA